MTEEELPVEEQPSPPEAETPTPVEERPPEPPSRVNRFLRSALRWVTAVAVIFALGVGTTWLVQVRPRVEEARALGSDLETATKEVDTLRGELEAARARVDSLESEAKRLRSQLEEAARTEQRLALLSVLLDVTSARLAMAEDDVVTAKAALAETDGRFAALQSDLEAGDAESLQAMRDRLALVIGELDSDPFAAKSDLEVLASSLLTLERSSFGE